MRKTHLFFLLLLLFSASVLYAQQADLKYYPKSTRAGEVTLLYSYGESNGTSSSRVYVIDVPRQNYYYVSTLVNMQLEQSFKTYIDESGLDYLFPSKTGWQYAYVKTPALLTAGKHAIRFSGPGPMIPMVDEIAAGTTPLTGKAEAPEAVLSFLNKVEQLKQQPVLASAGQDETGDLTNKVLPNPEGLYDHAIDTNFTYSHYSTVYLSAGSHTFTTSGSTINRSLTVFNPSNYTYSWSNVNGGPGGESGLYLYVGLAGYYSVMLRPYTSGSGTTNIILDGTTIVSGAIVGGRTYAMSTVKGGPLNFFTCRLIGGDTRMIASRYFASSARGYNDDYSGGGGDWSWGLASRIKKDFSGSDSVQYGFVCSYSPTSTGISDVYLGNANSEVNSTNYPEFPMLKPDDAIRTANNTNQYNCTSWAGGVTSTWIWPPSNYSTYSCSSSSSDIACFDNYFGNNPARYPGAWTYTRTGATVSNSVVDLWKLNGYFTHASVRKPGNNHPHGYDWESKPGGTARTFHPRFALTNLNFGYGAVTNYYIHTGGYGRNAAASFETDLDAVRAGVAIIDKASLTQGAEKKLQQLTRQVEFSFNSHFNELYEAWKNTWVSNAIYGDPAAYCQNAEYKALAAYAQKDTRHAMYLVFDKFVGGDHLIGELMWTLTNEKYSYLLNEVKTERLAKPNDEMGRYRIHGDHDNGVLYVEKILNLLTPEAAITTVVDDINVVVSPNPVKDRLTVQVVTAKTARVSVTAISTQTRLTRVMQAETQLPAGTHRFNMNVQGFAGTTGDIIAVQVMVDGKLKTVKVLVTK